MASTTFEVDIEERQLYTLKIKAATQEEAGALALRSASGLPQGGITREILRIAASNGGRRAEPKPEGDVKVKDAKAKRGKAASRREPNEGSLTHQVLEVVRRLGMGTVTQITEECADMNPHTVGSTLAQLANRGFVERVGSKRSGVYRLLEPSPEQLALMTPPGTNGKQPTGREPAPGTMVRQVLDFVREAGGEVTIADATAHFPEIKPNVVGVNLTTLAAKHWIRRIRTGVYAALGNGQ